MLQIKAIIYISTTRQPKYPKAQLPNDLITLVLFILTIHLFLFVLVFINHLLIWALVCPGGFIGLDFNRIHVAYYSSKVPII